MASEKTKMLEEIKNRIDKGYFESVEAIHFMKGFHYSNYHIADLFRDQYGLTIKQYLDKVRFQKAKELLESGMSIKATGIAVGMKWPTSFKKGFRRVIGVWPREVKKK